jgi:hypothetical protein
MQPKDKGHHPSMTWAQVPVHTKQLIPQPLTGIIGERKGGLITQI